MGEVTLTLKADNSDYIRKMKQSENAEQKVYDERKKNQDYDKKLMQNQMDMYTKVQGVRSKAALEEIRNQKEIARQIEETKKQTDSLTTSFSNWILKVAGGVVVLKALLNAFKETVGGMNLFNTVGAVTKTVLNDIVTTGQLSIKSIKIAISTQRELNDLRLKQYKETRDIARLNREYQEDYAKAIDQTLKQTDRLKAADDALLAHNKAINLQIGTVREEYDAILKRLEVSPTDALLKKAYELSAELENLEAARVSGVKRILSLRSGLEVDIEKERKKKLMDAWFKEIEDENKAYDERLRIQKEFQDKSKKLQDEYEKSVIGALTGEEKLKAQRDYAIKQLNIFKEELQALGELTPEMKMQIETIASNIHKEFARAMVKMGTLSDTEKDAISKALIGDLPKLAGIQKSHIRTFEGDEFKFNIWDKLGFSDEDKELFKDDLRDIYNSVTDTLNGIYDQRVYDTARTRSLLDTQIAETQRSLELETRLMEEGYANNVNAKKKELEALKVQRDKALKAEEEAIRKQQRMELVLQFINITTAITEAIKNTFKNIKEPISALIIAGLLSAGILTLFSSMKSKAKASTTMLAEGASGTEAGIITGRSHGAGGEHFLDHVEVERGEAFGVLSRKATGKFGPVFHEMVSSFNRDEMPQFIAPSVTNSVRVDNNGPNSRLDRVIKEQRRLNDNLMKQSQIYTVGGKRIIHNGNKTRIIG